MPSPTPHRFTVRGPADLLALVPYLVGYHPIDRLVAVGVHNAAPVFVASGELPATGTPLHETRAVLDNLAGLLARQHATAAVVIGYGAADRVDPVMAGIEEVLAAHQIRLHDALRVTDGRHVSYTCDNPDCCPPGGVPFDPTSSVLAAQATLAGLVALPGRATLAAQAAPVGWCGPHGDAARDRTCPGRADGPGGRRRRRRQHQTARSAVGPAGPGGRPPRPPVAGRTPRRPAGVRPMRARRNAHRR